MQKLFLSTRKNITSVLEVGVGAEMAFQPPQLNLIRLEYAMVPTKHLFHPVCPKVAKLCRKALAAYWPPSNSTAIKS